MNTLTLSNLGDSIPLSNLGGGGGGNPHEFSNSGFLHWISMKFCIIGSSSSANEFEFLFLARLDER